MVKNKLAPHLLANQLPVLVQEVPLVPSTAVVVLAKVGSRYETDAEAGIAHFLEHLAFKGTEKRPMTMDIASEVDKVGGEFNAFTSKEYTGFYIKTATQDARLSFDLLSDMLFSSNYDPQEIERERRVILEEMNMYLDTPQDRVGELFDSLLYANHPLGREIIGTVSSLESVGAEELRNFNARWYGADSLLLSVAGSLPEATVLADAEQYFSHRAAGQWHEAVSVNPVASERPSWRIQTKVTDQTHLVMGVRAFGSGDPRRHALTLLNVMWGGTMSSRLFIEVRERRGLAYSVHSSIDIFAEAGSLQCQVGLDHRRLPEVVSVVMDQCRLLRDQGVTEEELSRAKSYMRGRLALSLEDPLSLNIFAAKRLLLEGKVESVDELLEGLDAVTVEEVQQLAREIFVDSGLHAAVIGPQVDEGELGERLRIG